MGVLCKLGLHRWKNDDQQGSRVCSGCQHAEVRHYDKEMGTYWLRVT